MRNLSRQILILKTTVPYTGAHWVVAGVCRLSGFERVEILRMKYAAFSPVVPTVGVRNFPISPPKLIESPGKTTTVAGDPSFRDLQW